MSLSILGGPTTPPTTQPVPVDRLMALAMSVDEALRGSEHSTVSHELLSHLSTTLDAPITHLYAAAAFARLPFKHEHKQGVVVCTGRCQAWGALAELEWLLDERERRVGAGEPGFDVHTRSCLDQCSRPPVLRIYSSTSGTAVVAPFDRPKLREALELF